MTYGMNLILGGVSATAITAYGVYYKLQNFIFMPAYGLNNASVPILSFNYGAKEAGRIRQAIRWGLGAVSVIMLAGILCFTWREADRSVFCLSERLWSWCHGPAHHYAGFLFAEQTSFCRECVRRWEMGIFPIISMIGW
jgi:hypothetical protein